MRTALVGGGATGIGYAAAEELVKAGNHVIIAGRHEETLAAAADRLRATHGSQVGTLVLDVSKPDLSIVPDELDILVLNAGGPAPGRILDITDAQWQAAFELLVLGPLRLARHVLPGMASRGFGRVVLVTSTAVRQPIPDIAASVVLRSGATAAMKLLSHEFAAQGVTVNCMAPGSIDTDRRRSIIESRAQASGRTFDDVAAEEDAVIPAGPRRDAFRGRRRHRLPRLGGRQLRQRDSSHRRRRPY